MSLRRTLLALMFLAAASATAQDRFVNRDLNFSVVPPAADWKWDRLSSGGGVWVITNPQRTERFSVTTFAAGKMTIDEQFMLEMMRSVQRDAVLHSEKAENFRYARRTAPVYPSFTYTYDRVGADGKRLYIEGYVAAVGRVYALQYASTARAAKDEFQAFVSSFQVADKFESLRAGRSSGAATSMQSMMTAMAAPIGRVVAPNTEVIVH
jgi:hypothetical protein